MANKKPEFIREIYARTDMMTAKDDKVNSVLEEMIENNEFIDSVKTVVE